MDSDSETCNMTLENIFRGATHFKLVKTDVGGPRSAFFGKNRPINSLNTPKRQVQYMVAANAMPPADHGIRRRNGYMALDKVATGATHLELAKTDIGGPR